MATAFGANTVGILDNLFGPDSPSIFEGFQPPSNVGTPKRTGKDRLPKRQDRSTAKRVSLLERQTETLRIELATTQKALTQLEIAHHSLLKAFNMYYAKVSTKKDNPPFEENKRGFNPTQILRAPNLKMATGGLPSENSDDVRDNAATVEPTGVPSTNVAFTNGLPEL